jgi:uncharacterized protein with GYD domain
MPKFLVQSTYTADGVQGLQKEGAAARAKMAAQVAETVGGKLEAFYFAFGEQDVVAILDLPSVVDAAAIAFAVSRSGAIKTKTTLLMTPAEADQALKKNTGYKAPGK